MQSVRPKRKPHAEPIKQYSGQYKTADAYADALRSWIMQVYQVQCVHSSFPYFLANLQAQATQSNESATASSSSQTGTSNQQSTQQPQQPAQRQTLPQQRQQEFRRRGIEYVIPPIWKRVIAEAIDFVLLFAIKLGVTYAAVDAFDLLEDVNKYDFETLGSDFLTDYRMALSMTSEILFLELIHRIGTCVFEALCLHRGPGGVGGATPGKKFMGLRVVRCEWVSSTIGDQAIVFPSSDLGLGRAVVRSVVKNFSLTFLFPICFTLFSFQHSRTIYDILAGSIVVEDRRGRNRPIRVLNNNIQNNNNNNNFNNNNNNNNINNNINNNNGN